MTFLRRFFPNMLVKAALRLVDECDRIFSSDDPWSNSNLTIIKEDLRSKIKENPHAIKEAIKQGRSVKDFVYRGVATIAQVHVTSGQYHTGRGILGKSGPGPAFHQICIEAIDFMVREGFITVEIGEQWKSDIRQQISDTG